MSDDGRALGEAKDASRAVPARERNISMQDARPDHEWTPVPQADGEDAAQSQGAETESQGAQQ